MDCEVRPLNYPHGTDTYWKLYNYGKAKRGLSWDLLVVLGFMSGIWLSFWAIIATRAAGLFYDYSVPSSSGTANLVYGALFPGGLMAIGFTSSELYTGNVAAMTLYLLHEKTGKAFVDWIRVLGMSCVMNAVGGVTSAYFFGYLTNLFDPLTPQGDFLMSLAYKKLNFEFHQSLLLAIACNSVVCLTIFSTLQSDSFIGKITITWFLIAGFCWGGFEHLIANYFTVPLGMMIGDGLNYRVERGIGNLFVKNWLPVLLGNTIGGILFTSFVWWYTMRPVKTSREEAKLAKSISTTSSGDEKETV